MRWHTTLAVMRKELRHIVRDRMTFSLTLLSPLLAVQFGLDAPTMGVLLLSLLVGTPLLSFIGAVGAALTLGVRGGEVLLSLLVLPLAMPILIFGARGVDLAILGEPTRGPVLLLSALTILTLSLTPWAAASAVRISLE